MSNVKKVNKFDTSIQAISEQYNQFLAQVIRESDMSKSTLSGVRSYTTSDLDKDVDDRGI